eukprot:6260836-Alexandrium_andersonii.AAC.1
MGEAFASPPPLAFTIPPRSTGGRQSAISIMAGKRMGQEAERRMAGPASGPAHEVRVSRLGALP